MIYYVVEIDGIGFVFENMKSASAFMETAAIHGRQNRYHIHRPDICMLAVTEEKLYEAFPAEYVKPVDLPLPEAEEVTDETTT